MYLKCIQILMGTIILILIRYRQHCNSLSIYLWQWGPMSCQHQKTRSRPWSSGQPGHFMCIYPFTHSQMEMADYHDCYAIMLWDPYFHSMSPFTMSTIHVPAVTTTLKHWKMIANAPAKMVVFIQIHPPIVLHLTKFSSVQHQKQWLQWFWSRRGTRAESSEEVCILRLCFVHCMH